jgi:hypothetical protein
MRGFVLGGVCAAAVLMSGCQPAEEAPQAPAETAQAAYTPIPIGAEDEPGTPRQVRCQIGDRAEQDCTLTPLFGDESFQLDGQDIALRMVVTGNEGGLFEVFSAEHRVPLVGTYRRTSASDPCWTGAEAAGPSPICIRALP